MIIDEICFEYDFLRQVVLSQGGSLGEDHPIYIRFIIFPVNPILYVYRLLLPSSNRDYHAAYYGRLLWISIGKLF